MVGEPSIQPGGEPVVVPRGKRTTGKSKPGAAWSLAAKRAKLEDPDVLPARQRWRHPKALEASDQEEGEEEQEVAAALFSLASGALPPERPAAARPKQNEAPHAARGRGRGGGRGRAREQAASREASAEAGPIATPTAMKAAAATAGSVGPSMPLPGTSLGQFGMGAFAGTFPNGAYFNAAAAQAAAAAQGAMWPPSFPAGAPLGQPPAAAAGRDAEASAGQAGSGSGQEVLMPPQRRNWKRCASHVYIAHFIEYQIHKDRLQKQHQQQVLRGAGSGGLASEQQPILANGGAHGSPSLPPAADSGAPLQQQGSMQAPAKAPPASQQQQQLPRASSAAAPPQQQNGYAPPPPPQQQQSYAQQLQNQLLLQHSGAFPFLPHGMAHLGSQFGAGGGLTPAQAAAVAGAFPFPGPHGAHMLGLAGFGGLGAQLAAASSAAGQLNGFAAGRKLDPPKESDALKRGVSGAAAAAAPPPAMKPEEALKLGLAGALSGPEAVARLHALGVPSAMLNGGGGAGGGVPSSAAAGPTMSGFHEQLLAAAAAQRPEGQGAAVMR